MELVDVPRERTLETNEFPLVHTVLLIFSFAEYALSKLIFDTTGMNVVHYLNIKYIIFILC